MTKKNKKNTPVEIIRLRDENGNIYSDLLTLYNVYVPAVNHADADSVDENLKIFSAFFSADSEEQMEKFIDLYSESILGEKLVSAYSKAVLRGDLQTIKEREYFDMKISEQDIMEAKIEAREEGLAEGRAEGRIDTLRQAIENLKNIIGIETIITKFNITESERKILAI